MIIYKITNLINGKLYIGQTVQDIKKRMRDHLNSPKEYMAIGRAVIKYGKENFVYEIIDKAENQAELNEKEKFWIETLNTLVPNGYNIVIAKANGKMSDGTKLLISKSNKGRKLTDFQSESVRRSNKTRPVDATTREKMRAAQTNRSKLTDKIVGVRFDTNRNVYSAGYHFNGKSFYVGEYEDIEFAKIATDLWRFFLFGELYKLNNKVEDVRLIFSFLIIAVKYFPLEKYILARYDKSKEMSEDERQRRSVASKESANRNETREKTLLKRMMSGPESKNKRYSPYKGVSYDKSGRKWYARIQINGETIRSDRFLTEIEAAKAYDMLVIKYYGVQFYLNFPEVFEYMYN